MTISFGRPGEQVAAGGAAPAVHDPRAAEVEEDVLEEVHRDLLRLGDPLRAHGRVAVSGELDRGADGVVGLGGGAHALIIVRQWQDLRTPGIACAAESVSR